MCCARPWESPPPRWTALSGPAPEGALAVLPGRGWPSSPSKCRLRYLRPLLLGEPEPGLPGVPRALGESCVPLGHGAEPTLPTFSRDEGGQKLSVSSGPARGGHGEPDSSFIPRNAKKPHGTCPPEGGLPSACTSPSQGAVGEISLALVCPTSLSVTGEHTYSLEEVSAAVSQSKGQLGSDCPQMPGTQVALLCPWQEARSTGLSLCASCPSQGTIRTPTASCPWMSKAALTPPHIRRTVRTTVWRPRTNGTRAGALSTAPPKVRERHSRPGRRAEQHQGRSWWEVLAGRRAPPYNIRSTGKELGVPLGTLTASSQS